MGGQPNGSSECTDGYWVWPEGRAPYVANYAVRLPDEFVVHVLGEATGSSSLPSERRTGFFLVEGPGAATVPQVGSVTLAE